MNPIKFLQKHGVLRRIWNVLDAIVPSILKTVYFNFHYLPYKQARKLPIRLRNVRIVKQKGTIVIDAPEVYKGMIEFGHYKTTNYWCPNKRINLDLRGGKITFHGPSRFGFGTHIRVHGGGNLSIGKGATFASSLNLCVVYKVSIGDYSHFGWDVTLMDNDHHLIYDVIGQTYVKPYAPVIIGQGCWVGAKSFINKGTKLADHTIVSAASVVHGRFKEENIIIGGNPAVIVAKGYCITEESFHDYSVLNVSRNNN